MRLQSLCRCAAAKNQQARLPTACEMHGPWRPDLNAGSPTPHRLVVAACFQQDSRTLHMAASADVGPGVSKHSEVAERRPAVPGQETHPYGAENVDPLAPELSIIVPCLDEEDNVVITIEAISKALRDHDISSFEILILDDASTDQTFQRSVDYAALHPELRIFTYRRREPRRGYGAIVRHGVANAHGRFCVPVSGDGVDPVELIPEMLERARGGADLVQCSRYHREEHARTIPLSYKVLQSCWRTVIRIVTGQSFLDSTYAFKVFRRVDVVSRGITSNGFSIGPEIFFKTYLSGGRIEYAFSPQGSRRHGKSKFFFRREFFGFSYVLLRVTLHRLGILWF
jgi:dolichol-phosphate mannosyltransferase